MIVVDTNVIAHFLISGDRTEDAQSLFSHDDDWRTEPFALVELSNLLATACHSRGLSLSKASRVLDSAEQLLGGRMHAVAHSAALAMADKFAISAYDARFLAVAEQLGTGLVTEDARLRRVTPQRTLSIAEAIARIRG